MKKFLLVLLCFVAIFSVAGCKKKDNLSGISKNLTHYEINLDINAETKTIKAKQTTTYINNTNSILKTLKFHLYPQFFEQGGTEYVISNTKVNNAYPNGMSYANFNVDRVQIHEKEIPVVYEAEMESILSVELFNSLMPEEKVEIIMEYSFSIPNAHHRFGHGENTLNLGNFYPVACVFENGKFNTSPYNSNGDPFYSDCANYSVNVNIEKQYIVAGTGEKAEEKIDNGNKNILFCALAVRDFALVISDKFEVINEQTKTTNIEYYYFYDSNPQASLKAGVDAINTFSNLFGAYPYSTFSIVQADFIHGGMEYPNLIMISGSIANQDDYMNVIIHETAHQWWYGMVGNDEFKYPWLDEALTEYSTVLFYDHNQGYNLNHDLMINISKENYSLFVAVYKDVLGNLNTSMRAVNEYNTEPEYTYCTYVKGVLMWDSLNSLIGEKKLVAGLNSYFNTYKFKNATPKDLITILSDECGQNLQNFFNSWLNGHVVIK